jgi:hypothetical protein
MTWEQEAAAMNIYVQVLKYGLARDDIQEVTSSWQRLMRWRIRRDS